MLVHCRPVNDSCVMLVIESRQLCLKLVLLWKSASNKAHKRKTLISAEVRLKKWDWCGKMNTTSVCVWLFMSDCELLRELRSHRSSEYVSTCTGGTCWSAQTCSRAVSVSPLSTILFCKNYLYWLFERHKTLLPDLICVCVTVVLH